MAQSKPRKRQSRRSGTANAEARQAKSGVPVLSEDAQPGKDGLTPDDAAALERFCGAVPLDEVSFEAWQDHHIGLDLQVPLSVTSEQAATGATVVLRFSRTVAASDASRSRERVKVEISVPVPSGTRDGQVIRIEGAGDRHGLQRGNLLIRIRVAERLAPTTKTER